MKPARNHLTDKLAQLRGASDQDFIQRFPAAVAAVEEDFRQEEYLIESRDPASFRAHLEQHARMLAALHCTMNTACAGDTAPARFALELLQEWLASDASRMEQEPAGDPQAKRRATSAAQQ